MTTGNRVVATVLCLGMAGAAFSAAAAEQHSQGVETVTVTSQKKEENIQSVPIAVTALTSTQIEKTQSFTLEGLQGAVPNVQIGHFANTPHSAVFNIRGMGVIDPDPYAGNTVSIVVDGVPQYFNMVSLLNMFDIERVEILRGPQGTLFGANTTGGVVNVVTKQPTGEFGGEALASVGNYGRLDLNAAMDFPIIDGVLAGKVTVMHHGQDGFFTNVVDGKSMGDVDTTAVRSYLKYTGGDDFDATLVGEYVSSRNGSPALVNGAVPGEAFYVAPGIVYPGALLPMYESPCQPGLPCKAPKKYYSGNGQVPDQSDMDSYAGTLTMNWDSPIGQLTSITGYKSFSLKEYTDQDLSPVFLHDTYRPTKGWQFSQELRDRLQVTDGFELQLGGFVMVDHFYHVQNYRLQFAVPGFRQLTEMDQDNWSGSLFAQGYVDLTDSLRLQAGIRYTHERTKMTVGINNFMNFNGDSVFSGDTYIGGFLADGDQNLDYITRAKSWDNIGAKVGLDWQAADDMLLYAYYSRGFKSGGFVGRIVFPSDIGPYNPEYVDTVEGGIKSDWLDKRLRVNLALFQNWYKDMQVANIYRTKDVQGNDVNGNSILNAASSVIRGFELEVTTVPVDGLTLNGSLAYLAAHYSDFPFVDPNTLAVTQLKGNRLQNAPKWSATLGFTYAFTAGPGTMQLGMQYKYVSGKFNSNVLNTPRSYIQPTNLVDANIDWSPDNERWTISFWGRNLFDKRYIDVSYDSPGYFALVGYAPPREYGVSFKYKW
jgi:iron complex outermembrane receptor protein